VIEAELLQKIGTAYCENGEYDKAVKYFQKSLAQVDNVANEAKRGEISAKCHLGIGVATREPLANEKSLEELSKAIKHCEQFKKANFAAYCWVKANIYRNEGLTYLASKNFMLALAAFSQSKETAMQSKELADFIIPVTTYQGLALVLQGEVDKDLQNIEKGLQFLLDADERYSALPEPEKLADGCEDYGSFECHLAKACLLAKDYLSALTHYNVAYEMRKGLLGQHRNRLADVLVGMGRCYQGKGKLAEAQKHFTDAKDIYNALPKPEKTKALEAEKYLSEVNDKLVRNQFRRFPPPAQLVNSSTATGQAHSLTDSESMGLNTK